MDQGSQVVTGDPEATNWNGHESLRKEREQGKGGEGGSWYLMTLEPGTEQRQGTGKPDHGWRSRGKIPEQVEQEREVRDG